MRTIFTFSPVVRKKSTRIGGLQRLCPAITPHESVRQPWLFFWFRTDPAEQRSDPHHAHQRNNEDKISRRHVKP